MSQSIELPARVTIYPTNHCFKKCKHCFFVLNKTLNTSSLNYELIQETLKDLANHKVLLVGIAGGDPLKFPSIFEMIKDVIQLGMFPILTLSGANLNNKMVQDLYDVGTRSVQLSLDGATAEVHDEIRGAGSFVETVNAIKLMVSTGISVSLATCLNKRNVNDFSKILAIASTIGINKIKVQRWNSLDAKNLNSLKELTNEEFSFLGQQTKIKNEFKNLQIFFDKGDLQVKAANGFAIMPNGDLKWTEFSESFGNINKGLPSYFYRTNCEAIS